MIFADAVASGASPDAISIWSKIFSWLIASRTDSAAWAIAFTINTWAASIKSARISVYDEVHAIFSAYMNDTSYAQWLEQAQKLTDENGHKELRIRLDRLLKYIDKKDREFLADSQSPSTVTKRVMWCAAIVSVLAIIFECYRNFTLALLLPYPLFCLWQIVRGRWARFWVWWLRRSANSSLKKIEKRCEKKADVPPSMDELKKRINS